MNIIMHSSFFREGHFSIAEWLVNDKQCDVNCRDNYGQTPLHFACWWVDHVCHYRSVPAKRPLALNLLRLILWGVGTYPGKWVLTKRQNKLIDKWVWLQNAQSVACVATEQEKEVSHS